ncbi:DUF1905 domain-containing protein [Maribellus comscasis]|uniref:DUF1905 domain-containing protein n=2 Tax=Maribellus comscasis TaxID=2681766 RepID=A0A6I6JIZ3_9BACT|nr:DUF1905 domain-containing protein [Maribellus comscasis]
MNSVESPLVDKEYLMQKYPGKGGWTYAEIPEILQNKNNPFGWVKVKGSIDGFELKNYKLMPMGNGKLFLPVKAQIRKEIKKKAGDFVHIILFADDLPYKIPHEIQECLLNEPKEIAERFFNFSEGEQKAYIDWIYAAKTIKTKTHRIITMMERLQQNLKFYD